jgi:hypothetical protein
VLAVPALIAVCFLIRKFEFEMGENAIREEQLVSTYYYFRFTGPVIAFHVNKLE